MSSTPGDPGAMVRQGGTVGFQQQGSVDWVKVLGSSVSFGVEFLVRLCNGGVEPVTIIAAETVLARLKLGTIGEQRAIEATKRLKAFSTLHTALWFGFGAKHVTRQLAESTEGLNCVVVCSALLESYSAEDAGKILQKLLVSHQAPTRLSPSLQQWTNLVEACGAIFASSDFGLLLYQITRLNLPDGSPSIRFGSDPEKIADALRKLIAVSNGSIELMQLVGGPDCAWIAAFAAWFLDLPVQVQDAHGQLIYPSDQEPRSPKVVVIYDERLGTSLQLVKERTVIPSGETFVLLKSQPRVEGCTDALSYGRVPWSSLLCDTFGEPMRDLLEGGMVGSFGFALGCAARICEAIATHDPELPSHLQEKTRRSWEYINSSSHGRGFLNIISQHLPELAHSEKLNDAMENGYSTTCRDAVSEYEGAMNMLIASCNCQMCVAIKQNEPNKRPRITRFCKLSLVEVVVRLVQVISCLISPVPLRPSRVGLEWLYQHPRLLKKASYTTLHFREDEKSILESAAALFTGHFKPHFLLGSASASNGFCFFMDMLVNVSASVDRCKTLHIAPGCIEWNGTHFSNITDVQSEREDLLRQYEASSGKSISSTSSIDLEDSSSPNLKCELIIDESIEGYHKVLNAGYRVTRPDGHRFILGISDLITRIGKAATAKDCMGKECGPIPQFEIVPVRGEGIVVDGGNLPRNESVPLVVVLSKSIPAQLIALSQSRTFKQSADSQLQTDKLFEPILQDRQCCHCLLMSAIQGLRSKHVVSTRSFCIITW